MPLALEVSRPTFAGIATYPPGATFGPRTMIDYEFVWMMEGDAEYRWGATTVAAPAGAVVLCRPGAEDFFRWDPRGTTKHAYFHFDIEQIPPEWGEPASWPLVRAPDEGDILLALFAYVLRRHTSADPLLLKLTIAQMLWAFLKGESMRGELPEPALPMAVERALDHLYRSLDANPAASIHLEDLASAAAVTPEHLCRLFRRSLSRSPVETVWLARLDRALELVLRTNFSVAEIADACGFASPFHFSRRFKQAYGAPPRALRERVAAGDFPPLPRLLRWRSSG